MNSRPKPGSMAARGCSSRCRASQERSPLWSSMHSSRSCLSNSLQQVAHFAFLGSEIAARNSRDARLTGNPFDDLDPRVFELADFLRVVGKQANFLHSKFFQNLRGEIVIASIG